ncbi:hypothetical protein RIF29_38193 [Crotalaria pallida]|uniref:Uncharacterized protein n=1 Tax=Crotalaria pallida TaxID=3830 RepID=A0AAN9E1S4_CROPI
MGHSRLTMTFHTPFLRYIPNITNKFNPLPKFYPSASKPKRRRKRKKNNNNNKTRWYGLSLCNFQFKSLKKFYSLS